MPDKIFVGNFSKGLTRDRLPFVIDNDSFPTLINAYVWRGRVKRKRGTSQIGRLQRQLSAASAGTVALVAGPQIFDLRTALGLEANAEFTPGNLATLSIDIGAQTLTDTTGTGTLVVSGAGTITSATINYSVGTILIVSSAPTGLLAVTFTGSYYPYLPVMGLEDLIRPSGGQYPLLLAFDTKYSYQVNETVSPRFFYNTTYHYSDVLPLNPFTWSGSDFQQFWTTNYEGALWATNNKPGFHFEKINAVTAGAGTLSITTVGANTFKVGDYAFLYEITETVVAGQLSLNGVSGEVTVAGNPFTISVPVGTYNTYVSGGIAQYLTQTKSGDGIRWYNGDPTGGTGLPVSIKFGWVNFMPPLSQGTVNFDNLNDQQYYLVGALAIVPFKDRLLFFAPYVQSSTDVNPTLLSDTVIWSWNGTPYYSQPTPLTTGGNQYGYDSSSYFTDVTGKGGYLTAGLEQQIVTVNRNEDVLLVGFSNKQSRFVYTGNDLFPFLFYTINSELGSASTFSGIVLDRGAITIGSYGIALTTQVSSQRIDLAIPDEVFNIRQLPGQVVLGATVNTGPLRVNSGRDFFKEWIYFSYPSDDSPWIYPTHTFLFNYRDNTWSVLIENYTAHGSFRSSTNLTWASLQLSYPTWASWVDSWDSSVASSKFPSVCAGNQQGFVMQLADGTAEAQSQSIQAITATADPKKFLITSINHCLLNDDFIYLQNITGTSSLDGEIGKVSLIITGGSPDPDNFNLLFENDQTFVNYFGGGTYARLSRPFIQTKQFPTYWEEGRQVRLGVQQYLLDRTDNGRITLSIFLSMNPNAPYNFGPVVPSLNSINDGLVYTDELSTAPENGNLQTPTAGAQYQIWHRMNTSLIGDAFQVGFTLSDAQMYDLILATSEISVQGMIFDTSRGPYLS